jgi:hypothetical protein
MTNIKLIFQIVIFFVFILNNYSFAKVTGPCSNCHTMHNSQNGGAVARDGAGTGWDENGKLTGGSIQTTPLNTLLISGCVGCHSSTTGETIINVGGSRIPIVFNTGGYPPKPLAGGNFYHVSRGGAANDVYGHNVYGISDVDNNITEEEGAPGRDGGPGCKGCHYTLAKAPSLSSLGKNGCEGCHYNVAHHDDTKHWYRFLKGHLGDNFYVTGIEESDWEQSPTSDTHNIYQGTTAGYSWGTGLQSTHSVSAFCSGCHFEFHENMGASSQWLRHPTDILLPQTGKYEGYNPVTNYSVEAPVAWTDTSNRTRATAVVMCLSCHRAHGAPYADILRWDYKSMIAGGGNNTTGCFTCHTRKDTAP